MKNGLETPEQKASVDKDIATTKEAIAALWKQIVERDQGFVKALEAKPALAKDTTNAPLQQLYTNARERIQQEQERVGPPPPPRQPALESKSSSADCGCSLADISHQLRDKSHGAS